MLKETTYELFPTQYKFMFGYDQDRAKKERDKFIDVSLYQGGFGSGKTFIGSLRGLWFALNFAGCTGLVGAATQDLLDGTTKLKYEWHLANMGMVEGVHWWYSDRKTKMTFMNGSTIRFKTLANWENFRSTEFTWIEIEEASLIDEKTFKELMARLREPARSDWENPFKSMFLHTNPQGSRGWMYKFFHNPKTKVPNYRAVIAATTENTYLGKEYVDNLKDIYSADEIQELIMGKDCDKDNTIAFPDFTQEQNVVDNIEYNSHAKLILTCDFNYNPMCWYIMQEYDGCWYVLEELVFNSVTTKEMCKQIQPVLDKYPTKKLTIMGDAHGRDQKTNGSDYAVMLSHFSDCGYDCTLSVLPSNPLIKDRLAVLRGNIKNANGDVRLKINSTCKWLIYNLEECKNALNNGGLKLPTDKEIQNDNNKLYLIHPIDAISYPMYVLYKMRSLSSENESL